MSLVSNVGKGLIRWTPKIAEATADDIARFGPQAARVRALLNFIPTMSEDAAKISYAAKRAGDTDKAMFAAREAAFDAARYSEGYSARDAANDAAERTAWGATRGKYMDAADRGTRDAAYTEAVSDLIEPETYSTLTNRLASANALDRLAMRAPESFVPIARDMGERGLVSAPADIVTALRVSKLPQQQQSLVMGLVDSGMTLEEALQVMRALS